MLLFSTLPLLGAAAEFVLRFVYPPACAGLSGLPSPLGLDLDRGQRGSEAPSTHRAHGKGFLFP